MAKPLNPNQFKLFDNATAIKNSMVSSVDLDYEESMDSLWDRKLSEAKLPQNDRHHGSGLVDSIGAQGYRGAPVEVWHDDPAGPELGDGNHRVAAGAHVEATTGKNVWIPLSHESYENDPYFDPTRSEPHWAKRQRSGQNTS